MLSRLKFFTKTDCIAILLLILSSIVFLLDMLVFTVQPANMDGTSHITNMALFHNALSQGDFPVRWTDGFANYGLPVGSFIQQVTSYLGGFLTFLTQNVVVSFNYVFIIATVLSVVLFYIFLRFHFQQWPSFIGAFIFNFAPYRIINAYIRGASPEYFSSVFFVLLLLFLHLFFERKKWWSFLGISFSVFGLIVSHPMNVVTGAFFIGPYILYLTFQEKQKLTMLLYIFLSGVLGVILSGYYLLPLLKDINYFYYSLYTNYYTFNSTLDFKNFLDWRWYYFITQRNEILSRGHFIKTGLVEFLSLCVGSIFFIFHRIKKAQFSLFDLFIVIGIVTLFFTTKLAEPIYLSFDFLSNIQFPWRLLSTYIFVAPFLLAYLLSRLEKNNRHIISSAVGLLLIGSISWNRFAQVYGKNFTHFPQEYYYFTIDNLHSSNMNTIWTTKTTEYPTHKNEKVAVLEGVATIEELIVKNSSRTYTITSEDKVRMIDYTFYYPGWRVLVDGNETNIEFQDINYRGVITYWLPAGNHFVQVIFTNTKTVLIANFLTLLGICTTFLIVIFRKKIQHLFDKLL